jgi:hypothetical protein
MIVTATVVLRGKISIRIPETKRKEIASSALDLPMYLEDFELRNGITFNTEDLLNSDDLEIEDVQLTKD